MAANPMTQFNVYRIGPEIKVGEIDISFTNSSLFMMISTIVILLIFNLGAKKNSFYAGSIGDYAILSFNIMKNVTTLTGGALIDNKGNLIGIIAAGGGQYNDAVPAILLQDI